MRAGLSRFIYDDKKLIKTLMTTGTQIMKRKLFSFWTLDKHINLQRPHVKDQEKKKKKLVAKCSIMTTLSSRQSAENWPPAVYRSV